MKTVFNKPYFVWGLDVFNTLSTNDKGGRDGIEFYTNKIINREVFIFRVQ
jgi:hypothetical protein